MITAPDPALIRAIAVLLGSLVIGSIVRFIALRKSDPDTRKKRFASLRTWWMLAILISLGLLGGRLGISVLLGIASCIGWYELTRMFGPRAQDRVAIKAGYVIIVLNYLVVASGSLSLFPGFLPVLSLFVISISLLARGSRRVTFARQAPCSGGCCSLATASPMPLC